VSGLDSVLADSVAAGAYGSRSREVIGIWRIAAIAATALAFALALFMRLWHIAAVGFNSDEAVYAGQGASIAGDAALRPFFPIFRAHPLLYQTALSFGFLFGGGDRFGRLLSAGVGVATIVLTYKIGALLYGRRAGVLAAVFLSVMPYHVLVSRQVLLDLPEAFCATLTLYFLALYVRRGTRSWLYAAGGGLGLTFLSKEVGILFVGAVYAFLALSPSIRVRLRDLAVSLAVMVLVILPYPLSIAFAGKSHTGSAFLSYQLFRRPNHSFLFYPTTVSEAVGPLLLVVAAAGLVLLRSERDWRERLLLAWIVVPAIFFELWPVKGFQYLLPIAPPCALLAARALVRLADGAIPAIRSRWRGPVAALLAAAIALSLAASSWARIHPPRNGQFLAGSGGVPGGREAGEWVDAHVPAGSQMLAIGPSMANILEFYGHRTVFGLSVSANPLRRNPVYEAVRNPDLLIRHNDIQYVVWDSFSATRSHFFSDKILSFARRYNGRVEHTETIAVKTADGREIQKPVIVIYSVRP
jgi:Dolichyl-phosphate-mannose-protein mannosyltransferase